MEKVLNVYNYQNGKYIGGYDLEFIKNINMGMDSKICFYKVDDSIIDEFVKLGFEIQYQSMDLSRVARIRSEYHDEMGDSLYRMKIIDYNDLLFWKKNMEERVNTPLFNPQLYHALCSEIEKREQAKLNKDEAMNKIMLFIEALKKQYGEDVIDECLNDMSMKGTKII